MSSMQSNLSRPGDHFDVKKRRELSHSSESLTATSLRGGAGLRQDENLLIQSGLSVRGRSHNHPTRTSTEPHTLAVRML